MAQTISAPSDPAPFAGAKTNQGVAVTTADIIKSVRAVPVAPEVLPKLQSKLQDVDTDITDLSALIRLDAGLASSVLKTSNSAFYSRGARVTNIEEAVSVIGYEETLRIVARCSYSTVMKSSLDCYGVSGEDLWELAVLTAITMDKLGQAAGCDGSEAYISGLLHGVGKVAINDYLCKHGKPAAQAPLDPITATAQWEINSIGFHHGHIGAALMRQWRFADTVALAVEHHADPEPSAGDSPLAYILPIGVGIARYIRANPDVDHDSGPEFDLVRGKHARLDRAQLMDTVHDVRALWKQTRKFLV